MGTYNAPQAAALANGKPFLILFLLHSRQLQRHRTLNIHLDADGGSAAAAAVTDVWFSSPRPKKSATTPKPSAELRSCVKNLSCSRDHPGPCQTQELLQGDFTSAQETGC
jgi:hypothetical protein